MDSNVYFDLRTKYQFSIIHENYKNIKSKKNGANELSIYNFLSNLNTEELHFLKLYIEHLSYELANDFNSGRKRDYDAIEREFSYFINIITTMLIERTRK